MVLVVCRFATNPFPQQAERLCRQDVAAERVHARVLHASLVCTSPRPKLLVGILNSVNSEPTVFENYVHDLHIDDQMVELSLWDTAGAYPCFLLSLVPFDGLLCPCVHLVLF